MSDTNQRQQNYKETKDNKLDMMSSKIFKAKTDLKQPHYVSQLTIGGSESVTEVS